MALAHAKKTMTKNQTWAFNSLVSNYFNTEAFASTIVDEGIWIEGKNGEAKRGVLICIEGKA